MELLIITAIIVNRAHYKINQSMNVCNFCLNILLNGLHLQHECMITFSLKIVN